MQMYVSATILVAIILILCNAEPKKKSLAVANVAVADMTRYQLDGVMPSHYWQAQSSELQPQMIKHTPTDTIVVSPTIFYPLLLRLSGGGNPDKSSLPLSVDGEKPQHIENYSSSSSSSSHQIENTRVPSHFQENMTFSLNADNPSNLETHDKPINGNNANGGSAGEIDDNAIALEYLPTIAVPFLDTIAHGIIGEIQSHVQLIKPGTKWCGEGNKARNYGDVGVLYKTDKCCRNHDKCPYYILSHETKYGLHNDAHFTRSHCDCDASFYHCLKKVNSPFSTGVGITYFNILKMKCFRLEYPVVMCAQTSGWFSKQCVEYIINMGKKKQWQWFDNHEF